MTSSTFRAEGELLRTDEALQIVESEKDPITRALLNNANFWFLKRYYEQGARPVSDYDYAFFVELLLQMFREHDILRRILAGENVGQFFEDSSNNLESLEIEVAGTEPRELILRGRLDVTTAPKLQSVLWSQVTPQHRSIAFDVQHLTVVNHWVVAILWMFAEEARYSGAEVKFRGLDDSWMSYFHAISSTSDARIGDLADPNLMRSLFKKFSAMDRRQK